MRGMVDSDDSSMRVRAEPRKRARGGEVGLRLGMEGLCGVISTMSWRRAWNEFVG